MIPPIHLFKKLGYERIDREHAEIVRNIDQLNLVIHSRTEDKTLLKLFDLAIKSVELHLKYEEELMNKYNYENKENHLNEHQDILINLKNFRTKLQIEIKSLQKDFEKSVKRWIEHLYEHDQELINFINNKEKQ